MRVICRYVFESTAALCIAALLVYSQTGTRVMAAMTGAGVGMHNLVLREPRPALGPHRWGGWGSAARTTVYVSALGAHTVNLYDKNGTLRGQITGFGNPVGLAVDGAGNLYVADDVQNVVDVFKRGAHTPFAILQDGAASPATVAVGADGTVYASNVTNGSPGTISVWKPGQTKVAYQISDPNVFDFEGLALDAKNHLYATWYASGGSGGVDKVAPKSRTPRNLGLLDLHVPLDIALDHRGRLVIADAGCACLQVFRHGDFAPARTISGFSQPTEVAFDQKQRLLFVSDAQAADVVVLSYGSGKTKYTITAGLSASNYPWGVAVDPPAPL